MISEDSDQTAWMHRLILVFTVRTRLSVGIIVRWLIFFLFLQENILREALLMRTVGNMVYHIRPNYLTVGLSFLKITGKTVVKYLPKKGTL